MNQWQRQRAEAEDRAKELTLPKILARAVFFGTLLALLIWGPWALLSRLIICASGALAYVAVSNTKPLQRHM